MNSNSTPLSLFVSRNTLTYLGARTGTDHIDEDVARLCTVLGISEDMRCRLDRALLLFELRRFPKPTPFDEGFRFEATDKNERVFASVTMGGQHLRPMASMDETIAQFLGKKKRK